MPFNQNKAKDYKIYGGYEDYGLSSVILVIFYFKLNLNSLIHDSWSCSHLPQPPRP